MPNMLATTLRLTPWYPQSAAYQFKLRAADGLAAIDARTAAVLRAFGWGSGFAQ